MCDMYSKNVMCVYDVCIYGLYFCCFLYVCMYARLGYVMFVMCFVYVCSVCMYVMYARYV